MKKQITFYGAIQSREGYEVIWSPFCLTLTILIVQQTTTENAKSKDKEACYHHNQENEDTKQLKFQPSVLESDQMSSIAIFMFTSSSLVNFL